MDGSYELDVLEWSEHQARLLRQHAAGQTSNETPDWPHIIEEVESIGRSQLAAVQSLLVQAMLHELKADAWPWAREVPHWRAEARGFQRDAARSFAPSMRQRIDLASLYRDAIDRMPETIDGRPPLPVPPAPQASLDSLLGLGE